MFLDEAIITVKGGYGGRGCISWRREKYVPRGGPNGGDGGQGGNVYIEADANRDTLSDFASTKYFEAGRGNPGSGKNKNGKCGNDLVLLVPLGTLAAQISSSDSEVLFDLDSIGKRALVAKGGRGGYGNAHFKSSVRQRPDFAELGEPGKEKKLKLTLKMVAEAGIIGLPSSGKSTLISAISSAKPKIAAYPFTTLVPNLGVVSLKGRSFVVCDVPGLIEGASEGKGLGDRFLRHIERCRILLHILDISRAKEGDCVNISKLKDDYETIRKELLNYSKTLCDKKEIIILNKTDLINYKDDLLIKKLRSMGIGVKMGISAAAKHGTDKLIDILLKEIISKRKKPKFIERNNEELIEIKPLDESNKMGAYGIEKLDGGIIAVHGKRLEQFTKMTDFSSEGARKRFYDVVERIGLKRALLSEGYEKGVKVMIGDVSVEEYLNI